MNPAPPAPRVTTERVARYIDAHRVTGSTATTGCGIAADLLDAREWIATMGAVIAEWQAAQQVAAERIAELEATVENDQGRGDPPSPGWRFVVDDSLHGRWEHPKRLGMVQRAMVRGWYWTDWDHSFHPDRVKVTAREAMRAADAARGPT